MRLVRLCSLVLAAAAVSGCALPAGEEDVATVTEALSFNFTLQPGQRLQMGDKVIAKNYATGQPQTNVYLVMQNDCNLVLYSNGVALWNAGTMSASLNCYAVMQTDGNFVVYRDGVARWNSRTVGNPGMSLFLWYERFKGRSYHRLWVQGARWCDIYSEYGWGHSCLNGTLPS